MAQRLEHRSYKAGVDGSIPSGSTINKDNPNAFLLFTFNMKADIIRLML